MSNQIPPPKYNSEWHLQPQASYPAQPGPYDGPQQLVGYPSHEGRPPQPAPFQQPYPAYPPQQPYPAYPPQQPQYQMPATPYPQPVNIHINNVQNGYPQPIFDPYRGQATTALTMGIIAVLIWIIPFIGTLISLICAIIGFITGIQGRKSITRSGSATTGLVLSIIALVFIVGAILVFGTAFLSLLAAKGGMH